MQKINVQAISQFLIKAKVIENISIRRAGNDFYDGVLKWEYDLKLIKEKDNFDDPVFKSTY